ncbi:hypothetical protein FIBSPDRAFT_962306 [Athelia psychrophila]|uniref:RlpA-like protein double-psi beta-barrel domain-containing protein n=1 Tax=Athelia psychrophila TaxID=1759441 RepID=A0A166ABE5_9AGAM|nr:hypothetical protein FIBSPDRAFT_962306 [Fibularhizoctonia sp. CBS 109695]
MQIRCPRFLLLASVAAVASAQSYSGDGTFYAPGLGACGISNTAADPIVAVAFELFDTWPGATQNPNLNPICGKTLTATYNGVSVNATVVDLCGGCTGLGDLDFSPDLFDQLAPESVGRLFGVTWEFTS